MPQLLISYRRRDSAAYAGRLYDRLAAAFGESSVFMDIDTIRPGDDFVDTIRRALERADVVLALIGPTWLESLDDQGRRRLEDPDDYLRLEISESLAGDVVLVPVLVGGAVMPDARDLPEGIRALGRRHAFKVNDERFHADVDALLAFLSALDGSDPSPDNAAPPASAAPVVPGPPATASQDAEVSPTASPDATDARRARLEALDSSPWLDTNMLWSLGLVSLGLSYSVIAAFIVRGTDRALAGQATDAPPVTAFAWPPPSLRMATALQACGWLLAAALLVLVATDSSGVAQSDRWPLVGIAAAALWAGCLLAFRWAWQEGLRIDDLRRDANVDASDAPPGWRRTVLAKIIAMGVLTGFCCWIEMAVYREGLLRVEAATSAPALLEDLLVFGALLLALPFALFNACHSCWTDLYWPLLRRSPRPRSLAALVRKGFWPWLWISAALALLALGWVNERALRDLALLFAG